MIPLLFEDVKFGALQQRRAGAKEGAQKINSKCWNSQFADKFNYFAWASSIHKILTYNINKKGLQQQQHRSKQASI